jgi:hypothetical protein
MKLSGPPQPSGEQASLPPGADGIDLSSFRLQPVLDADLDAPRDVQVVLVNEPGAFAKRSVANVTSGEDAATSQEP